MTTSLGRRTASILFLIVITALMSTVALSQQFISFDPPGSTNTYPETINNLGQIVGGYEDSNGVGHGFLLSGGVFTTIDFPGSAYTLAGGINNAGEIIGYYVDANGILHGFSLNNGTFNTIPDDPLFPGQTFPFDITDLGLVVGNVTDAQGNNHGFTLSNSVFTQIDFPGATSTTILDVNYGGSEIVGSYSLPSFPPQTAQGFIDIPGSFSSDTFPGSVSTYLNGVNKSGGIAGTYVLPGETISHVFVQTGNNFTTEDFPGAAATEASDLNDVGQVIGVYIDGNGINHGYFMSNGPFAYIAGGGVVSVLDTSTNLIVATLPIGGNPYELAVTPDQSHIYVANLANNNVSVIATATNTVEPNAIAVGPGPDGLVVTPNGQFVYVANNDSNNPSSKTVSVISTATNSVVDTVTVGPAPFLPKVTPDGTYVAVSNQNDTVSVINTSNYAVTTYNTPVETTGLAFTPNGAFGYLAENTTPGAVLVVSPGPTTVTTIPLGQGTSAPIKVAVTPDGSLVYVTNLGSNNVSVIDTATNTAIATIPVGSLPYAVAVSPDGSQVYVGNAGDSTISIISTATNKVVATIPVPGVTGIAIATASPSSQSVTQPLNPTQPNNFNFGTNDFQVQYPAGSGFSNIDMTVISVQITQAQFQQRVAGTPFANTNCIVYQGAGGNCIDDQVTCSQNGSPVTCPSESTSSIGVQTSFSSTQPIVNPGYLTTPIGQNNWTNIFTGLSDITVKGKTKGFSEFVAVDLGAANKQGAGTFTLLPPLLSTKTTAFAVGTDLDVSFQLASIANPGQPVTDSVANLTLIYAANSSGQTQNTVVLDRKNAFAYKSGVGYSSHIDTSKYAPGNYILVVYGNAFPAQQIQFSLMVKQAPAFTTPNATTFAPGVQNIFTVTTSGFPAPSITESGSLPAGVSFIDNGNGTGTLSGTPSSTGVFTFNFTAQNGIGSPATQVFTLTVGQAPFITSANAATFGTGIANTFTVTTVGSPTPSLTEAGVLPAGVTFVDNGNGTGTLRGTPATAGVFNISFTAQNGIGSPATQAFTLTVAQAPAITSANAATFAPGVANAFTVTTTGVPTPSLSESGSLPAGVTFVDNGNGTGTLGGTPTVSGIFQLAFTATNVVTSVTQSFTLTVASTAPSSGSSCNGIYSGTFQGNINVSAGQSCTFVGGGVTGNITLTGGSFALSNAAIGGNLQVNGGGAFTLGPKTTLRGNLQVQNVPVGPAQNQVCGTTISGNLQFQNNRTALVIGSSSPACPGNLIGGDLQVQNNAADTSMYGNSVGGNLQVQNNNAPTQVFYNVVRHNLQCQNNSSITGGGNTASQKQGQCANF